MEQRSFQTGFAGREDELESLESYFQEAVEGEGSTVFISGEAGVGKTRLVEELIEEAKERNAKIIKGKCLSDSLDPLMPVREALRDADLGHLLSEDPPPKVKAAYLINDAGLLAAKAERKDTDLDPDIFVSMLSAVERFVQDSLSMMDEEKASDLNTIGYGEHDILVQTVDTFSLACVIEGRKSEFLIEDMRKPLAKANRILTDWQGDMEEAEKVAPEVEWFIESGKYDGEYLVDEPEIKQENLFENVLLGLQRLSSEQPILLFLDDLHSADPTSLKLIHYLSRNTKDDKVLILGTYRPEDIVERTDGEVHQLKTAMQEMNREGLFEKIELERLDEPDVEEFIKKTLGRIELEDEVVKKLYEECEGNPFFLLELLRDLVEKGHLENEEGAWKAEETLEEVHIPEKVYDLVVRRLDRLMEEQRELLESASVVGEEFESDVLGNVTGMNRVKLLKKLNEIERTHNLIRSIKKKYRFDHSKIREVLYNGLNEELQREYHRIVAKSYKELYKDDIEIVAGKIGQHYYKANDERAGKYLLRAGERARERYANEEAEMFYEDSIDILEEEDRLKKAYEALGDVHELMGKYEDAFKEYERASDLVEKPGKKADLHGKMAKIYQQQGEFDKSLETCEKGLGLVEEHINESTAAEDKLWLLDVKGWSFYSMGEYDRVEEAWREGVRIAEEAGDDKEIAHALHNLGSLYIRRGEYDKALELLDETLQIREEIGDEEGLSDPLNNIGVVYKDKGELDKSLEHYEESLEISRKIGDQEGIGTSLNNIGNVYRQKGELDRALEHYEESLEISREIGAKEGIAESLKNVAKVYRHKGQIEKSKEYIEESLDICSKIGNKQVSIETLCELAEARKEEGQHDAALQNAKRAVELSTEMGAKQKEGRSRRVLGMVYRKKDELERAEKEVKKAEKSIEDSSLNIDLPKVTYEHALLFVESGEVKRAEEYLNEARDSFRKSGMELWAEKCEESLKDLNADK
ncbi:MAG: tetratricopeptide repeat protein [Candidatus Thermoplasmatota archaeon]